MFYPSHNESRPLLEKYWLAKYQSDYEKNRFSLIDLLIPPTKRSLKALDIGCAMGFFTNLLYEKGYEAVGIDLNTDVLRFAKERFPHCEFKAMNASHLDFPRSSFNFVLALETIEHLKNPRSLLFGIQRVLKENGTLLLSTPNKLSLEGVKGQVIEKLTGIEWNAWDPEHKHIFTSFELIKLLKQFFRIEHVVGFYYVPLIPPAKYDILNKTSFRKMRYLSFRRHPLSMFGFITVVGCKKREKECV